MKQVRKKTDNQRGFSLAETLVALIIILLVSSVVAAGMPAAEKAYVKVQESADAQVFLSTTLIELRNELATASEISMGTSKMKPTKTQKTIKGSVINYVNPITGESSISFDTENGCFIITSYQDIGSYQRKLVSDSAKTNTLKVSYSGSLFTYDASADSITVAPLSVQSKSGNNVAQLQNSYIIRVLVPAEIPD